jgi:hypothetical protein
MGPAHSKTSPFCDSRKFEVGSTLSPHKNILHTENLLPFSLNLSILDKTKAFASCIAIAVAVDAEKTKRQKI